MAKFGVLKSKILQTITEAYAKGDKKQIKKILKTIKENEDFKGLYVFYEHVEDRYIEDREDAKIFVNAIVPLLQEKSKAVVSTSKGLNESLKDVVISTNTVYDDLDILSEQDTLLNVDKKIFAKLRLIEHLVTKKETKEEKSPIIENTTLLHTILSNNFNVLYSNTLNEEEKKQLTDILSITDDDLQKNFQTLKEEAKVKTNAMLMTESNLDVKNKLTEVLDEINRMTVTRFNYYKLTELKNGL